MTQPEQAYGLGWLDDPLADWPNDDLLLKPESRDRIRMDHPSLLKVLDWPELRTEFEQHDAWANEKGRKCRRFGLSAVACGTGGMVLAALAPILATVDWLPGSIVGLLAASLTIVGTALGLAAWISARHRSDWLIHRFWTERLRQFHFQFLINNFDLAARATGNDPSLRKYHKLRAEALGRLVTDRFRDVPSLIKALQQDEAELSPWLEEDWASHVAAVTDSDRERMLLKALHKQRFGIQIEYVEKKLDENINSPNMRGKAVRTGCDILTFLAMLLAGLTGALLLSGHELDAFFVRLSMGVGATASVLVLALRILDEGLQLRADEERYSWYLSALRALHDRFVQADSNGKHVALRELEHLCYQEMRRFIVAHKRARFLL